jgi:hypothetical protein
MTSVNYCHRRNKSGSNPAFQFMTLISLFHRGIAAAFRRHLNRLDPAATSSPEAPVTRTM